MSRLWRIAVGFSYVAAGALTLALAMNLWIRHAARPYIHADLTTLPQRSTAIVPGASVFSDGTPSAALADRLRAALAVYRAGRVTQILASGVDEGRGYDEVGAMSRWLKTAGVPATAIVEDRGGARTFDTMERARRVFGVDSAIVCTQGFHLPRAVFLARHAGIDALGFRADGRVYQDAMRDELREFFARIKAFLDTYVLPTEPRHGADLPAGDASTPARTP